MFRVVSVSGGDSSVDLEFLPAQESRAPKDVPEGTRVRLASKAAFLARRPIPVYLTPTGYLKWKPPAGN